MLLNLVDTCLEAFKSASLFHKLDHILCIVILSCRCFEGQEASLIKFNWFPLPMLNEAACTWKEPVISITLNCTIYAYFIRCPPWWMLRF